MTISAGASEYSLGNAPVTGGGRSWTEEELADALENDVASLVFDDTGKADLEQLLAEVADTEFEQEGIARVLGVDVEVEDWRVGEAIAEGYLTEHRECSFPWPDGRDERKRGSSLPGADLVGFRGDGVNDRFAFGEVKTSSEAKHPPQVMYGRTGLTKQLEDLRDNFRIRDDLVKYLGFRAIGAAWQDRYQAASKRYVNNNADVRIFGVLIRDVSPNKSDLETRLEKLTVDCPDGTEIELLAIYLPGGSVGTLAAKVAAARNGGAE